MATDTKKFAEIYPKFFSAQIECQGDEIKINDKKMKVKDVYEFTFALRKTHIKAKGGASGLSIWLKKLRQQFFEPNPATLTWGEQICEWVEIYGK